MSNKVKSKKSVVRRFKVTGSGKVLHLLSFRRHLKSNKSKRAKRQHQVELTGANLRKIKKLLKI